MVFQVFFSNTLFFSKISKYRGILKKGVRVTYDVAIHSRQLFFENNKCFLFFSKFYGFCMSWRILITWSGIDISISVTHKKVTFLRYIFHLRIVFDWWEEKRTFLCKVAGLNSFYSCATWRFFHHHIREILVKKLHRWNLLSFTFLTGKYEVPEKRCQSAVEPLQSIIRNKD